MLYLANVTLAAAIVAAVAMAFGPLDEPRAKGRLAGPLTQAAEHEDTVAPLEHYAAIYERQLRKPLFEPATKQAVVAAPPAKPPDIHPIGTALERGGGCGMFRTASGEMRVVQVGESIDGAELVSVTAESVTVRFGGRLLTMPCEKGGR